MSEAERDPYAEIAEWYDLEHDPVTEDIECYQELIASALGARVEVLEIGSGSGRIAAALALAGHTVTGVEPSPAMRARAQKRLAALPERVARRVRQIAGTALTPTLAPDARFDLLLFGCNTFAHLTTATERRQALAGLRAHLRPDGALILDCDLAGPRQMAETAGQLWLSGIWPCPGSARMIAHFSTASTAGPDAETVALTHLYDVWEPGGPISRTATQMTLALLAADEVERMLLALGFAISARYGAYDLAPLEEDSPRALFVARPTPSSPTTSNPPS